MMLPGDSRSNEFRLLCLVYTLLFLSFTGAIHHLAQSGIAVEWRWIPVALLCMSSLTGHLVLRFMGSSSDQAILPLVTVLCSIGVVYQLRMTVETGLWKVAGTAAPAALTPLLIVLTGMLFRHGRIRILDRFRWFWMLACLGIPAVVVLAGVEYRGAIYGPGLTTPTEFFKPVFLIALAGLMSDRRFVSAQKKRLFSKQIWLTHVPILLIWGVSQIFFLIQRDLGMIAISTMMLVLFLWMATGKPVYLAGGLFFALTGGWVFRTFITRGLARFQAWLSPFDFPDTSGFQVIQSLFALFHGEFLGQGIGGGFPARLPMAETDFIYSVLAEELGFMGSVMILLCFMLLARRALIIGQQCPDRFTALISTGTGCLLTVQVFLNAGGVIKLLPMTGVALPWISLGGSAALMAAALTGWVIAASEPGKSTRHCKQPVRYANKKEDTTL